MPIATPAILAGIPLIAAGAKYLWENPRRVLQKGIEGLELASGLSLSAVHPWYGATLAAKAGSRLLGWQQDYPSTTRGFQRRYESVYARSFKNAPPTFQTSKFGTWRRKKIWRPKRKVWGKKNWKNHYPAKKIWKSYRTAKKRIWKKKTW